ncbi:D-glycero-alpha-D-manno-heptose-1,7-bisphosphate 7-phosphatase [Blastochloris viridis]|uniref:D,D-heptose 1,7-bisphosphate phosphatase n=1 Tax=Blastochloris viridis TaxID=1079 RepID=A0A0H5BIC3_BLAVI|nr:HAD family hydrolase [Blastochloris viridis]ALK09919.1 D-glycero-beta-D-manno-heptose-1,7-bisphosphate 7-phosphatase [Blastochloris viridis]BAS00172.1 D-glycero-D-manno-heptose 1,7-bisphosphate phosphatase [Blastochloris viridis]CUU42582.1 D,D-heptose 1,7-bisphosphate phosphatase [Blastochloris viridis]
MTAPAQPRLALLDRDGTIIIDRGYLADPSGIAFAPGALAGLRLLRDAGFTLALVTNQSGIARGYFDEATLAAIHRRLEALLAAEGLHLGAVYHCPHGPDDGCACRKPAPGLLTAAMRDLGFAPDEAVMIGDSCGDMAAAAAAGIEGIRIGPGAAPDFLDAAQRAIGHFARRRAA